MQQLMTKESLDKFLNKEFPQVSKNFKILNVSDQSFSMLMYITCLLYTSQSPRDTERSRMPSSA